MKVNPLRLVVLLHAAVQVTALTTTNTNNEITTTTTITTSTTPTSIIAIKAATTVILHDCSQSNRTFYAGRYDKIEDKNSTFHAEFPIYEKLNVYTNENLTVLLYVNDNGDWVLGNSLKEDFIFKMSVKKYDQSAFSPATWPEWRSDKKRSDKTTHLWLKDSTFLPPYHVTLSSKDNEETFYAGNFTLNIYNMTNNRPEYVNNDKHSLLLYYNKNSVWVLGDEDHNDYTLNLSTSNAPSPSSWPDSEWTNNETYESPNLFLTNPSFLPPWRVTLSVPYLNALHNGTNWTFDGEYILNLTNTVNGCPLYESADGTSLYFSNENWVFGDKTCDYVFKLSNSTETSLAKWTNHYPKWINNGTYENPLLSVGDQSDFPPQYFAFLPIGARNSTFYEGLYSLRLLPYNDMPEFQKDNSDTLLYISDTTNLWVLGNLSHVDTVFNISNKTHRVNPINWSDKWNINYTSPEGPKLQLINANSLPPLRFSVVPFFSGTFYEGDYNLKIFSPGMPEFQRDDGTTLYVNETRGCWVLRKLDNNDYVFTISSKIKEVSPSGWTDGWTNINPKTPETPVIQILNTSFLPPVHLVLRPEKLAENTFYNGTYDLDMFALHSDMPQYIQRQNKSLKIYLNNKGVWVLGDVNYMDYCLKLSLSDTATSNPSQWPEWRNTRQLFPETPVLVPRDSSFLPPMQVTFLPSEETDKTVYGGKYTLCLMPFEGNPQYLKDDYKTLLYVSQDRGSWVLGNTTHNDYIFNISRNTEEASPLRWKEWQNTSPETPTAPVIQLLDPTFLPPLQVTLSPNVSTDQTFYAGVYTVDLFKEYNFHPQYKSEVKEDILFYVNDVTTTPVWIMGDQDHIDYSAMNLSIVKSSKWPSLWTNWVNIGTDETPNLLLKDPTSLPPLNITLAPKFESDEPLYAGKFTLNLTDTYNNMPQYTKLTRSKPTILYFNGSRGVWTLGDIYHNDYIFNMSNSPRLSPVHWTEWKQVGTLENPTLYKNNHFDFPPYSLVLKSNNSREKTFYEGTYMLDLYDYHNYHCQYLSLHHGKRLYVSPEDIWVLGDFYHTDYILRLTEKTVFSPSLWEEWHDIGQTPETPTLILNDPIFLPPLHLSLVPNIKDDPAFYVGYYTLNVSDRWQCKPQYYREDDNILLYVSKNRSQWVLGDRNHDDYIFNISTMTGVESPVKWTDGWRNTRPETPESPEMQLKNSTFLPPWHVILSPFVSTDKPFYAGNYTVDLFDEHNYYPKYKQCENDNIFLYVNSEEPPVWILGVENFTDYKKENLSNVKTVISWPSLWNNWNNIGTMETPNLSIKNPTNNPPWIITILPIVTGDNPFYAGVYKLDLEETYSDLSQYKKENTSVPTLLYFNASKNAWVLGDLNHTDYIFNISMFGKLELDEWDEWRNNGSLEFPLLYRKNFTDLPPYNVTLVASTEEDETFYEGNYILDLYYRYNNNFQYLKSKTEQKLYVNDQGTWVLGDTNHNDFTLNLTAGQTPSSPYF